MIEYFKSEIIKLSHQKLFVFALMSYFSFYIALLIQIREREFVNQYRFFSTVTILFLCIYQILSFGELHEKKIIRYYFEYIPNRSKLIALEYLKYILAYVVLNVPVLLYGFSFWGLVKYQVFLYFMIYLLYLVINMNLVIYFEKVGVTIILSLLLLWILPNLVNLLLVRTSIYYVQVFYYLSPDSFTKVTFVTFCIAMLYIGVLFLLSLLQFNSKEY